MADLREHALAFGVQTLADVDLLTLLLGTGSAGEPVAATNPPVSRPAAPTRLSIRRDRIRDPLRAFNDADAEMLSARAELALNKY